MTWAGSTGCFGGHFFFSPALLCSTHSVPFETVGCVTMSFTNGALEG